MKWFCTLLFCLTASAQLPVIPYPVPSGLVTPGSLGPTYWWVSSDMATNTAVLSWVDRIAGNIRTNGDATTRPTNSATGVGFAGNNYLSNSVTWLMNNVGAYSSGTFWTVFTPRATGGNGCFEGTTDAGGHGNLYAKAGNTLGPFASGTTDFASFAPGVTYSLTMVQTNGVSSLNILYYTNTIKIIAINNGWAASSNMKWCGRDGFGDPCNGKIVEAAYWQRALSDNEITNVLYNYTKNTYGSFFP